MSVKEITVNGQVYPVAPMEPEHWDHPSPAFPLAVTPEVARRWLRFNYRNRNQREAGKRDYSTDMEEKGFAINGSSVTFSRPLAEGEDDLIPAGKPVLMDGQHRLEACVRSNTPFVVYVAYGIDPGVRHTIDTGIKRSFSDVLQLRGEKNTMVLASVIKRVHAWLHGDKHLTLKKVTATHSQMADFLDEHPEIRRSAEIASRAQGEFVLTTGQSLRQSVVGTAHWLFMQADERLAPEFFARLGDGASMPLNHPIMVLRRRLVKDLTVKQQPIGGTRRELLYIPDWQQMCYYIRTWNAYLLWQQTPDSKLSDFKKFSLVGRMDSEKMPSVHSMKDSVEDLEVEESA
jgi:hypothetical protein